MTTTIKKPRINNQIIAKEIRVIGKDGENLGVLSREEALKKAQDQELDLIEVSATANPPVARIMDYGKFIYEQEKKEREVHKKTHQVETKEIKIGIGTSFYDLQMKAKKIDKFLGQRDRVTINLLLKGRAKDLNKEFIKERLKRLLDLIEEKYKIVDGPKSNPRGLTITIEKEK